VVPTDHHQREDHLIQAVIFDMDGLLVDSEPVWDKARKAMADVAGMPWGRLDHDAVMGVSTEEWADYMIEHLELEMSRQEVIAEVIGRMTEMYRHGVPYFPGAVELVDAVAATWRTGLASGSHPALIDIVTADEPMAGRFEVIVAADKVGAGKPAPDVYLEAARALDVDPADCVCLEDSGNGILSGAAAGMKVIAVPDPRYPPAPEKLERADLVAGSLADVTVERIAQLG
jgi:HAD superfamily hydrolase (TIGR01509 family)